MDDKELIQILTSSSENADLRAQLTGQVEQLDLAGQNQVFEALKKKADELMRTNLLRCWQVVDLMDELAARTANPLQRAMGLLAKANAFSIGVGDFRQAVVCYDEAAALFAAHGSQVQQALTQIGRISALSMLGRFGEALHAGEWAMDVFRQHAERFHLARMMVNLATIRGRMGQDDESLELFDQAREIYRQLGIEGEPHWLRVELNRAVALRNLGRFDESIQASRTAIENYRRLGQAVTVARAEQGLAVTYLVLGRYNEALAMLDEIREVLLQDGRRRDAMLVELFISDCLLQLRRFEDVLEKCRLARRNFSALGTPAEVAQAILNEASAFAGLERYAEALGSLEEARQSFEQNGNLVAMANTDLQMASVLLNQGQSDRAFTLAQTCALLYADYNLPVWQARACLAAARAALALGQLEQARSFVAQALEAGESRHMPTLTFPCRHLLGQMAVQQGRLIEGLANFERAIQDLELLCGRLMVEFRASFVEDKQRLYEDVVELSLDLGLPGRGLEFAERAKSRALLDLLAHRLDLSITARSEADRPLVAELTRLRAERDTLYRRWEGGEGYGQRGESTGFDEMRTGTERQVLMLEKRITELWHKLLVRNAGYAREAALWQVHAEPAQPYLSPDSLVLEYFTVHGRLVVFLVTRTAIQAVRLPADLHQVQRLLQLFWLNLKAVQRSTVESYPALAANLQGILHRLYLALIDPVADQLASFPSLVIVPHGPLHYLPFQALFDGQGYLLERHALSYLPGSSLLRYCRPGEPREKSGTGSQPTSKTMVAVGHSYQGRLPFTIQEASAVATLWSSQPLLEEQATLAEVRQSATTAGILHLAAHGDFRPDNPLFSGLALTGGWLTTLEIFNLRLTASLVTLSACQTGRSVVGGGDELLGLMRSFLAAGAASLVATLWAVEDRSTALLMSSFYQNLAAGLSKGAALRQAQLELLHGQAGESHAHPYFWAPFFLVGDEGAL